MCRRSPDHPLPSEIVMFLYYTSITVALVRLNQPISELTSTSQHLSVAAAKLTETIQRFRVNGK